MAKKGNLEVSVAETVKQTLEGLSGCLIKVCNEIDCVVKENEVLRGRLDEAEWLLADLSCRVDNAELRSGIAKTDKITDSIEVAIKALDRFGAKGPQTEEEWKEFNEMGGVLPRHIKFAKPSNIITNIPDVESEVT